MITVESLRTYSLEFSKVFITLVFIVILFFQGSVSTFSYFSKYGYPDTLNIKDEYYSILHTCTKIEAIIDQIMRIQSPTAKGEVCS